MQELSEYFLQALNKVFLVSTVSSVRVVHRIEYLVDVKLLFGH